MGNSWPGAYITTVKSDKHISQRTQCSLEEKGLDMNARFLKCTVGAGLVLGMLAALPAQAGGGLIKVTHASTPYKAAAQPAPKVVAKAQPAVPQIKAPEVQVAVMAKSPSQPAGRRSVFILR